MLSKVVKYIKEPGNFILFLQNRCNFRVLSDEAYLKVCYQVLFGEKLDLDNPKKFSEKLQWLKIHDRKPEYTNMVDKYEAKKYIAEKLGSEYVIPSLGVWEQFDDIDFDALPDQFVLKCTHDSGGVVIVRDKSQMDLPAIRRKLEKNLKINYFYSGREWPYKNVRPRIIAEQYLAELSGLRDYKFFCFSGEMKLLLVVQGRGTDHVTGNYFDENGEPVDLISSSFPRDDRSPELPDSFAEMKRIAEILSAGIPHVRVDLYDVNGKIYFGELTFFDSSGFDRLQPESWDRKIGDMLKLPGTGEKNV